MLWSVAYFGKFRHTLEGDEMLLKGPREWDGVEWFLMSWFVLSVSLSVLYVVLDNFGRGAFMVALMLLIFVPFAVRRFRTRLILKRLGIKDGGR